MAPRAALALALLLAGCADPSVPVLAPATLPDPAPWDGPDLRPALEHPFFDDHPALADLSLFAGHVEGPVEQRPDPAHRGAFAVGNGAMFAFLGLTDPVNTLHSPIGPVYERDSSFFGDQAWHLTVDGVDEPFDAEWVARVRGTAVVVTRADSERLSLYTVDFAPRPAGVADLDVPPAIVRVALVVAREDIGGDLALRIDPYRDAELIEGVLQERIVEDGIALGYLPWEGALEPAGGGAVLPLPSLAAGETARAAVALATGYTTAELDDVADALAQTSADAWLDQTVAWWHSYRDRGVQVSLGDPRVEDLIDAMKTGIRVQQSAAGATSPMSQFTLVWLRNTPGPVRLFLRLGLHEEAWAALDYHFQCAVVAGDHTNACASGLTPDDWVAPPDWAQLGPFEGQQRAEAPSYIPLMYRDYTAWSSDWSAVEPRWDYLRRALLAQEIDAHGRQPFSGDETFRVAMSAALGYELTYPYEELTWSANSSLLTAAASDWMAVAAERLGLPDDAAEFAARAALARAALDETFLQDDGHYTPFVVLDGGEPAPQPFEDVQLRALWSGAVAADDPVAWTNLAALRAIAGRGDGTVQSPLHPDLHGVYEGVDEGIHTGMVPGFYLDNLTRLGDPEAAAAFDALYAYADPAGQFSEYMVYDDHAALQIIYDPAGFIGDYAARHCPWEGSVDVEALLHYLIGPQLEPGRDALVLRPHLPNQLPAMTVTGLRAGAARAEFTIRRTLDGLAMDVRSTADQPFPLALELPLPFDAAPPTAGTLDGAPAGELRTLPGGEVQLVFAPFDVAPDAEHRFTARVE